jgi:ribosome recycling factor
VISLAQDQIGTVITEAESKMKKALEVFKKDLSGIRTGRASSALVDRISVEYYGVPTPMSQLANVSTPEAQLIVIQPWDKSMLGPIEKAILKSDLGLTPTNDGRVVRLAIPRLSEERRKELVKVTHRRTEDAKVAIRNVRRDAVEHFKKLEKDKLISEDDVKHGQERLQKVTDGFIAEADHMFTDKEKDILEV